MQNRTSILSFIVVAAGTAALLATTANSQLGAPKGYVSLQPTTPGTSQSGHTNVSGTAKAGQFVGGGAGLTGLNASNLANGTVADARLSSNVALLTGTQTFSGAKTFSAASVFNGTVGVGTSSPLRALSIVGGLVVDQGNQNGSDSNTFGINLGNGEGTGIASNRSGAGVNLNGLNFYAGDNSFPRMVLTTSGQLGIGTSFPGATLHVSGGAFISDNVGIGTGAPTAKLHVVGSGIFTGNVGIGTASPERNLHVFAGSAGTVTADVSAPLVIESDSNAFVNILSPDGAEKGILFGGPISQFDGSIRYNNSGNVRGFQFRANGNIPRLVVTSAGDVGIGTTAPTAKLDVNGTIRIAATTRYYAIPAAAFGSSNSSYTQYQAPPNSIFLESDLAHSQVYAWATLNLPDGATITQFRALVDGGAAPDTVTVSLIRQSQTEVPPASSLMASVNTLGGSGVLTTTTITNPVIDNAAFAYHAEVHWVASGSNTARLYGVRIAYTITSPLP